MPTIRPHSARRHEGLSSSSSSELSGSSSASSVSSSHAPPRSTISERTLRRAMAVTSDGSASQASRMSSCHSLQVMPARAKTKPPSHIVKMRRSSFARNQPGWCAMH
eukprot:6591506-Prymnesium_polylepis.2